MSMLGLESLPPADEPQEPIHREAEDSTRRIAEDAASPVRPARAASRMQPGAGTPSGPTHADTAVVADRLQFLFGSRFEVVKPIAIGGMATIFQMRHRLHGGLFVAKVLHPQLAGKERRHRQLSHGGAQCRKTRRPPQCRAHLRHGRS